MKGIQIRTNYGASEKIATLLDATPTQIEVTDLQQAFSNGRVEAMLTSPSTGVACHAWNFMEYFTNIQEGLPKNIVVMNKKAFHRLDQKSQTALLQAAAEAESRGWKMSREETGKNLQIMKAHNMKIIQPSPKLMANLKAISNRIIAEWEQETGPNGIKILTTYKSRD